MWEGDGTLYDMESKINFSLNWISGEDQLADDCTKSQEAKKSFPHFERTLIKIPDRVKGFRTSTVGNR